MVPKSTSEKQRRSASCQSSSSTAPTRQLKKKKDMKLHQLIFEEDGILEGTAVSYYSKGEQVIKGRMTASGIHCNHCEKDISPSEFEKHANNGSKKRPYSYIHLMNGITLHQVALYLKEVRASKDNNELLCDTCRTFFHKDSASLPTYSLGERHCKLCKNDCLVHDSFSVSSGSVAECKICIVGNKEDRDIVCVSCRGYNFCNCRWDLLATIICSQCEKEYHKGCLTKEQCEKEYHKGCLTKEPDLKERPEGNWFCRSECKDFFTTLQNLVEEVPKENYIGILLESLHKEHKEKMSMIVTGESIGWSIHHTKSSINHDWQRDAFSIFQENFGCIKSSVNGSDIIDDMVHGNGQYSTMYCAVVGDGSSSVAAGLVRIVGQDLAELPLAATAKAHQKTGYMYLLIGCLQIFLQKLNVKMLAIPATKQSKSMWMEKFGFKDMSGQRLSAYKDDCWGRTNFSDTKMLYKLLT